MDLILYHGPGCPDGFCAAWLCYYAFPDAEFVPVQYGQEPPAVAGRDVLIVDFSYPRATLEAMHAAARSLVVLDHHKSAAAELEGLPYCTFDLEKSGARLTWEYLYGKRLLPDDWLATNRSGLSLGVPPWLVDYTEDRDLWRWQLPDSRAINAGLATHAHDFGTWDMLLKSGPHDLAHGGRYILRYQEQLIDRITAHARRVLLDGHEVWAVNTPVLQSEVAGKLAEGRPFGVVWYRAADGALIFSLRSRADGVDVSEVARSFGGGGHRNAAGFRVQDRDFDAFAHLGK